MRIRFSLGKTAGSGWKSGWNPPSVAIRYGRSPQLERRPPSPVILNTPRTVPRRMVASISSVWRTGSKTPTASTWTSRIRSCSGMAMRSEPSTMILVSPFRSRTRRSRRSPAGRGTRRRAGSTRAAWSARTRSAGLRREERGEVAEQDRRVADRILGEQDVADRAGRQPLAQRVGVGSPVDADDAADADPEDPVADVPAGTERRADDEDEASARDRRRRGPGQLVDAEAR